MRANTNQPKRRLVLVACAETLAEGAALLAHAPEGFVAVGALLVGGVGKPDAAASPLTLFGSFDDIERVRRDHPFDTALVCLPVARARESVAVREALGDLDIETTWVRTLADALRAPAGALDEAPARGRGRREVDELTLIDRAPRQVDRGLLQRAVRGKRVLITGAGGSIGAELARVAASHAPEELVLMDRSENALFEINRQIGALFPDVSRRAVLHDVVDADGTLRLFVRLRPQVVYHAAAHKHVPMMEDHPAHAVDNNLFGAKSAADAAVALGAERFVFISTDKAVHPTSVMGATKRLAELYIRSVTAGQRDPARTRLCMVRFGNVLGSAGSVLPIWRKQLDEGGAITVTDPRMTRYFMTIPEAATLVMQASALNADEVDGADVFVLDMGEPASILELAKRFIAANGFTPLVDPPRDETAPGSVEIRFTGARPGEKLHEELSYTDEHLRPTRIPGVLAWAGAEEHNVSTAAMIAELSTVRRSPDTETVVATIRKWVQAPSEQGVRPVPAPSRLGVA